MYHLLVSYTGWNTSQGSLSTNRVFEYTSDKAEEIFKPKGRLDISKISKIPAIFASETGGEGKQFAHIGVIDGVRIFGNDVRINYHFLEFVWVCNVLSSNLQGIFAIWRMQLQVNLTKKQKRLCLFLSLLTHPVLRGYNP